MLQLKLLYIKAFTVKNTIILVVILCAPTKIGEKMNMIKIGFLPSQILANTEAEVKCESSFGSCDMLE